MTGGSMSKSTRTLLWILFGVAVTLLVLFAGVVFFLRATAT